MGLPVLSCLGNAFAARIGASLLNAVGLPELVARDSAEYVRRAAELATQPDVLKQLSARLVSQRNAAPLFDTPRFARNLERAYEAMWDVYAAGHKPRPLKIDER